MESQKSNKREFYRETERNNDTSSRSSRKRKNSSTRGSVRSDVSEENEQPHTSDTNTSTSKSSSKTKKDIEVQTVSSFISSRSKQCCPDNTNKEKNQYYAMVIMDTRSGNPRKFFISDIDIKTFESHFKK